MRVDKNLLWSFLCLTVFFVSLYFIVGENLKEVEKAALKLARPDTGSAYYSWLTPLMIFITHVGDSITLIIISLLVLACMYKKVSKTTFLLMFASYAVVFISTPLLKSLFGRVRPDVTEHLVHAASASMPSGHALRSAVVYLLSYMILSRFIPALVAARNYIGLLVVGIGFSRLYLGVHWPTDVLAGWYLAAVWLTACYFILSKRADF